MKKILISTIIILKATIMLHAVIIQTAGNLNVAGGNLSINGNFINESGSLSTIAGNVTVSGTTTINGILNLKSSATATSSFITYGAVSGSGITNAERYMSGTPGAGDVWHNCSASVTGQNIQNFLVDPLNAIPFKNSTTYGCEYYDEANGVWTYYTTSNLPDADLSTFSQGKGYLLRRTSNGAVTFSGSLNSGPISPAVTSSRNGWNSIGNPYPSSIGLNSGTTSTNFITENIPNLDPSFVAAYFWSGTSYIPVNNSSSATYIQPGQGFVVKSNIGGGTMNFNTSMQAHYNPTFYKKSSSTSWDEIILQVKSAEDTAITKVLFNDEMTPGLDISYDAGFFAGSGDIQLYSKLVEDNGINFAIQCLPNQEPDSLQIPIGIDCKSGGIVTFNASINHLPMGYKAILEDRLLGSFTDLSVSGASYEVALEAGTKGTGRFYLHNGNGTNNLLTDAEKIITYSVKKDIYIKGSVSSDGKVSIFDLKGRKMADFNLNSADELNVINLEALNEGIYIVKVTDKKTLKMDRVFISE